jgi:hypothetical protein
MPVPRYTIADLKRLEAGVNRDLAFTGTRERYLVQRRNGYTAIDIYDAADPADWDVEAGRATWRMTSTLIAGLSVQEAVHILMGMSQAVYAVTRDAVITRT